MLMNGYVCEVQHIYFILAGHDLVARNQWPTLMSAGNHNFMACFASFTFTFRLVDGCIHPSGTLFLWHSLAFTSECVNMLLKSHTVRRREQRTHFLIVTCCCRWIKPYDWEYSYEHISVVQYSVPIVRHLLKIPVSIVILERGWSQVQFIWDVHHEILWITEHSQNTKSHSTF